MTKKIFLVSLLLASGIMAYAMTPLKKDTTRNNVSLRIAAEKHPAGRPSTPLNNSLWINRDATINGYTPDELVKKVLLNSYSKEDEDRIQNVKHIGWNWDQGTETWKQVSTPANTDIWGEAVNVVWGEDERSLLHFQRGPNVDEKLFDLSRGLLLATGPALTAEGPNETNHGLNDGVKNDGEQGVHEGPNAFSHNPSAWDHDQSFDRDLDGLTNQNFNLWSTCGSVLEFDFQPAIDKAFFDYIFASDEYPEGIYETNDVFGFFVTGPYDEPPGSDIEGTSATPSIIDPTTLGVNSKENGVYYRYNIARLPDSKPVGIDYVNWGRPIDFDALVYSLNEYEQTTTDDYYMTLPDTMTRGKGNWTQTYFQNIEHTTDPTPGTASKYGMHHPNSDGTSTVWCAIPTNPELFRYNHIGEPLMEYDGYTQKLRAVADNLIPGKWYHLKLAIAQTRSVRLYESPLVYYSDFNHGSGCFLSSLDLGKAGIDFSSQYLSGSRANSQFHNIGAEYSSLDKSTKGHIHNIIVNTPGLEAADTAKYKGFIYSDCEYAIEKEKLTFAGVGNIVLHTYGNVLNDYLQIDSMFVSGEKVEYCYEKGTGIEKDFSEYVWGEDTIRRKNSDMNGELYFSMKPLPEDMNGNLFGIANLIYFEENPAGVGDTIFFLGFNKVETDVKFYPVTEVNMGSLSLGLKGGSKYIRWTTVNGIGCNAEFNDNCRWRFLRDTVTGEELPFSNRELLGLYDGDNRVPLILQEPGSCWYDTVWIGGSNLATIRRYIDIPFVQGVSTEPKYGKHYVEGNKNFSFTATYGDIPFDVTATGYYSGRILDLSETSELQADGSYKYTIPRVTEPQTVRFMPSTTSGDVSNETILNPSVWTNGSMLHVNSSKAGSIARIYSLNGVLCEQFTIVTPGTVTRKLPRGIYIVTINNDAVKKIRIE